MGQGVLFVKDRVPLFKVSQDGYKFFGMSFIEASRCVKQHQASGKVVEP